MVYELLMFVVRPLRRWWRRALVAAIVATVVVPAGRELLAERAGARDTITIPPVSP